VSTPADSDRAERAREGAERVLSGGDWEAAPRYYTPDVVVYHPVEKEPIRGLDEFRRLVEGARSGFPDLRFEPAEVFTAGDRGAVRFRVSGTHQGSFVGFPPSGGRFETDELALLRFDGDRVAEVRLVPDLTGQMQQLGLIPEGPPPRLLLMLMKLKPAGAPPTLPPEGEEPQPDSGESEAVRTVRGGIGVVNTGEWARAEEFFAPDVVTHHPTEKEPIHGLEALRRLVETARTGFPDLRFRVEEIFSAGDRVGARYTVRGTHTGNFVGFKPTGREFAVPEIAHYRLAGGKVVEARLMPDLTTQMQQLGLIPEGPPPKPMLLLMRFMQRRSRKKQ
jgi:steroid delta-isomerase-like uncharacterized protein